MRFLCILAGLIIVPVVLADEPQGSGKTPIGPAQAAKLARQREVTVEMVVKSVGVSQGKERWWLNTEEDWKDGKNFTVFIPKGAVEGFKKMNITDPVEAFKGKTILATGYLAMHDKTPELVLHKADNLKVK